MLNFLNKDIINFSGKIFGLDISDLSIKLVQLERNGNREGIRSHSIVPVPENAINDSDIIKKDQVINSIREAVRKSGPQRVNTKKVICSIPESKAFLRIITIPRVKEEEAREAVKWEIEASIPLSIDQVYFDWQFLDGDYSCHEVEEAEKSKGKGQNVLTIAVAKEVVDGFVEVIEGAGLEVYGLELESIASARSLIPSETSFDQVSLIVDLGAKRTSFILAEGTVPYFTSSIPFSGETMTDAISKYLGIKIEEAEKMKIARGIADDKDAAIRGAVGPLLENLTTEISKSIDFYKDMTKGKREIKKIILSGGAANLKGMVPYLSKKMNREVEMGDPWNNLNLGHKLPIIDKENCISYATAIGLAMRGLDYEN